MKEAVSKVIGISLGGLFLASCAVQAPPQGSARGYVEIRSGPAADYPLVGLVQPGISLTVMGCLSDYSWCDVSHQGLRGWVYGGYVDYPYQGRNAPVLNYGSYIGIPIITFSFVQYWDTHYYRQPWYRERQRWANHPPPPYRPQALPDHPRALPAPPPPEPPQPRRPAPGPETRPLLPPEPGRPAIGIPRGSEAQRPAAPIRSEPPPPRAGVLEPRAAPPQEPGQPAIAPRRGGDLPRPATGGPDRQPPAARPGPRSEQELDKERLKDRRGRVKRPEDEPGKPDRDNPDPR